MARAMKRFAPFLASRLESLIDVGGRDRYGRGVRYVSAVGWVGLAVLVRLPLGAWIGGANPFVFFYLAVLFAAWFGGFGPGVLATALSAGAAICLWAWPQSWSSLPPHAWLHPLLFAAVGLLSSVFAEALHRAVLAGTSAEQQAQADRERFRVTLASIGDAVIATDEGGRVQFMNPVAEQVTGWTADEARGQPLDEVFVIADEQTRERVESPVRRVLESGHVVGLGTHTILRARDGRERPVEDSAAPIRGSGGDVRGVVLVFRDATARRQAEQRMQQQAEELERRVEARTAELREKVAELEAFSYSVSHDLRTPLRAILGYCELLTEQLNGRIDAESYGYLQRVDAAARRLDRLVLDVLTYSSIARGPLGRDRIDLEKFLPQVIELYPAWHEPAVTLELRRPLLPVVGYESFLTQCVTNLLSNAVKFVAPGAKPRVTVGTEKREGQVRLWVEDNGVGVPEGERERIFQMFERGTADPRIPGTGIGLAVVRKATQRMGGRVGVEPGGEGGGSRFWIELPAADS